MPSLRKDLWWVTLIHRETACEIITEEFYLWIKAILCTQLHITKVKTHHLILINIMLIVPMTHCFRHTKMEPQKISPDKVTALNILRRNCRHKFKAPGMGVHLHLGNAWYSLLSRTKFWGANIKYVFTGVACILRNKEKQCAAYPSASDPFPSPLPRLVLPRTSHTGEHLTKQRSREVTIPRLWGNYLEGGKCIRSDVKRWHLHVSEEVVKLFWPQDDFS